MSLMNDTAVPLRHLDRFFIGGEWVKPSTDSTIDVTDSTTEEHFFSVAEAQEQDMSRAVAAARQAFDAGPWPRLTHAERAEYLRAIAEGLRKRGDDVGQIWPREAGVLHGIAKGRPRARPVRLTTTHRWPRRSRGKSRPRRPPVASSA